MEILKKPADYLPNFKLVQREQPRSQETYPTTCNILFSWSTSWNTLNCGIPSYKCNWSELSSTYDHFPGKWLYGGTFQRRCSPHSRRPQLSCSASIWAWFQALGTTWSLRIRSFHLARFSPDQSRWSEKIQNSKRPLLGQQSPKNSAYSQFTVFIYSQITRLQVLDKDIEFLGSTSSLRNWTGSTYSMHDVGRVKVFETSKYLISKEHDLLFA